MLTLSFGRRHFATISGKVKIFLANAHFLKYMTSFGIVLLLIYLGHVHSIAEVFKNNKKSGFL